MIRLAYRMLVALHPPNFREQHGEEMLCIFDESARGEARGLIADGLLSLTRQWVWHSGAWKLAAGTAISSILLVCWGYSIPRDLSWSMRWGAERNAKLLAMYPSKQVRPLDRREFAREAAQAVAMLARMRRAERKRHHADHGDKPAIGSIRAPKNPANSD
jgi:hypothetical protein